MTLVLSIFPLCILPVIPGWSGTIPGTPPRCASMTQGSESFSHSGQQLRRGWVPEHTLFLLLTSGPLYSVLPLTSAWNVLPCISYLVNSDSSSSSSIQRGHFWLQEVKKLDPERLKQKLQLLVVKVEKASIVLSSGLNLIVDSTRDTSTHQVGVGHAPIGTSMSEAEEVAQAKCSTQRI